MSEPLLAGFARVDITPALDDPPSFEIFDPIYLRALHLRQGGRRVTFLAADLFVLDEAMLASAERRLAAAGVDAGWVLPGASHIGTGPTLFSSYHNQPTEALKEFGRDEDYAGAAAGAVEAACRDAVPARLALGAGTAEPDLQYNRRAHDEEGRLRMVSLTEFPTPPEELRYDAVDRQVGVLRVDREGRRPAALVAFGCHALALWDDRGNISGDYPGRLSRELAADGIDSLFFQGALGNVHPVRREQDPAARIGRSLAATVRQVWSGLEPGPADLELRSATVELEPAATASVEAAKAEWESRPLRGGRAGALRLLAGPPLRGEGRAAGHPERRRHRRRRAAARAGPSLSSRRRKRSVPPSPPIRWWSCRTPVPRWATCRRRRPTGRAATSRSSPPWAPARSRGCAGPPSSC